MAPLQGVELVPVYAVLARVCAPLWALLVNLLTGYSETKIPKLVILTTIRVLYFFLHINISSTFVDNFPGIISLMTVEHSGRRCSKHHFGSNFYLHLSYGCQWCSYCTRYFPVSSIFCHSSSIYQILLLCQIIFLRALHLLESSFLIVYFLGNFRYLISLILLWTLIGQVDLLPPRIKDLQFGRFLKNGEGLLYN